MVKKDYIYWESYPEEEFNYIKCLDSEAVDSLDKAIYDDMKKYPKGYYEVEYEFAMDYEYDEFGPAYSYYVLVGIKVLRRRMFVGWLKFFLKRHDPIDYIKKLFGPYWRVDFEYDGVGVSKSNMYLPKALCVRFFFPRRYADKHCWVVIIQKLSCIEGSGHTYSARYRPTVV